MCLPRPESRGAFIPVPCLVVLAVIDWFSIRQVVLGGRARPWLFSQGLNGAKSSGLGAKIEVQNMLVALTVFRVQQCLSRVVVNPDI